jgi:hypothetical protein
MKKPELIFLYFFSRKSEKAKQRLMKSIFNIEPEREGERARVSEARR